MRCKNCGWENPDGLTRCEKCGAPLSGGVNNQMAGAGNTAREDAGCYTPQAAPLNKTVCEAAAFPDAAQPAANVCPKCGYPLRPGVTVCPNCHYGSTEVEPQVPMNHPAAPVHQPVQPHAGQGTVNPWIQVAGANKCSLEPIAQIGIETPEKIALKGNIHTLNRANLDPENQTITSKVQAELVCEDGQWFICDKSAQHTTFVYAGEKTPVKDGDVILMGNRQFVFHKDN